MERYFKGPTSKVIQLVKHSQDGSIDSITFLALCEDGSIWYFFPSLDAKTGKWELLAEICE